MRQSDVAPGKIAVTSVRVLKLDLSGAVVWEYEGRILRRDAHSVVLEALFDKPDFPLLDVILKKGDRFVETYYDNRAYNVFEIYDRDSAQLKGWYCNLSRPAYITAGEISWVDLSLDLWVWPDGRSAILDEAEFNALQLGPAERRRLRRSVRELEQAFLNKRPPV